MELTLDLHSARMTTLVSAWLTERTGRPIILTPGESIPETHAFLATGRIGDEPLAAMIAWIVPPTGTGDWYTAKADVERRSAARLPGAYLVWVPQGVELPEREPLSSELVMQLEDGLSRYVPGGHGELRFPINLRLRKSDAEGTYITARGGLAPHWAQFTNRVSGHFQLDSTDLHRIPTGEGYLNDLIERVVTVANQLELGAGSDIPSEDAWAGQRLLAGTGVTLVGEPPGSELSSGAALRRGLRRTMQAIHAPLRAVAAQARIVVFVGPYSTFEGQPVSTALLGFDPALIRGIDLIAVAAEAQVRPVLNLTRLPLLGEA